ERGGRRVPAEGVGEVVVAHEGDEAPDLSLVGLSSEIGGHRGKSVHRPLRRLAALDALLREELLRRLLRGRALARRSQLHDGVLLLAHGGHRLRRVLRLPSWRELDLELQLRMEEELSLEEALPRILAVDEPVDDLQVLVAADLGAREVVLDLLEPLLGRA